MNNLIHEIADYTDELKGFIDDEGLPAEWFHRLDYVGVKTADSRHFFELLESFKTEEIAKIEKITCTVLHKRRIIAAFLASQLAVDESWATNLVIVREPRPEKVGLDIVGVDHMQFNPKQKLSELDGLLQSDHRIRPARVPGSGHNTLIVKLGSVSGREVHFTDKSQASTINDEIRSGETEVIYQRGET